MLGHVWPMVMKIATLALVFFWFADRLYRRFARAFGSRAALFDPTGLPVQLFAAPLFGLLAQPAPNALIRVGENESDRDSLESVNLPDALGSALVKTAEYRYPRPGALEEFVFYSHPSVERRVRRAMDWKAEHGGR